MALLPPIFLTPCYKEKPQPGMSIDIVLVAVFYYFVCKSFFASGDEKVAPSS